MAVFRDVVPSSMEEVYLRHQLIMEAASTSETSVNLYQTVRRKIPKDSHFHTRRHGNMVTWNVTQLQVSSTSDSKAIKFPETLSFNEFACIRTVRQRTSLVTTEGV
jgi:hypothetical protein